MTSSAHLSLYLLDSFRFPAPKIIDKQILDFDNTAGRSWCASRLFIYYVFKKFSYFDQGLWWKINIGMMMSSPIMLQK